MLTNRKKLKIRKKRFKMILLGIIFVVSATAFLTYWLWINIFSKTHYISPLASNILSINSVKQDKEIMKIEDLLKEKQIDFVSVNDSGKTYIISLKNGGEVVISQEKDLNTQISSLQFMLSRLTMEGRKIKRLDLQFDNPVVVFN